MSGLTICEHYNNGHCLKYNEDCFNQCVQKQVSEDAISREWVKKAIKKYGETYGTGTTMYLEQIAPKFIDEAPSVIPKPKEGEWYRQTTDHFDYWECSECGMGVGLDDIKNYCPNCGAKMKGAER